MRSFLEDRKHTEGKAKNTQMQKKNVFVFTYVCHFQVRVVILICKSTRNRLKDFLKIQKTRNYYLFIKNATYLFIKSMSDPKFFEIVIVHYNILQSNFVHETQEI